MCDTVVFRGLWRTSTWRQIPIVLAHQGWVMADEPLWVQGTGFLFLRGIDDHCLCPVASVPALSQRWLDLLQQLRWSSRELAYCSSDRRLTRTNIWQGAPLATWPEVAKLWPGCVTAHPWVGVPPVAAPPPPRIVTPRS